VSGECPAPEARVNECRLVQGGMLEHVFIYVLISTLDNKFYVGFTENLQQRLEDHNSGKVPSTSSRRPLNVIYYEAHLSKSDALRREQYFKTSKGKTTLKQMLRDSLEEMNS